MSDQLTALYVRAGDELLAVMRPTGGTWTTRYVHLDALSSIRALTDEAGIVADMRDYEAFGTMNVQAGSDPLPYRFAGEAFERTSNLAYHRARWMDPRVGRFHGMDPWDRSKDVFLSNLYAYADSEPVGHLDPTGKYSMASVSVTVAIVGVFSALSLPSDTKVSLRSEPSSVELRQRRIAFWIGEIGLGDHLYILSTAKDRKRTVFEAGPERDNPNDRGSDLVGAPYGKTWEDAQRDGASDLNVRATLSANDDKLQCLQSAAAAWNGKSLKYEATGPNSNTAAVWMCRQCGLLTDRLPSPLVEIGLWGASQGFKIP